MSEATATGPAPGLRIEANPFRVRAMFAGHVIADTAKALTVYEPGRRPAHVFPAEDVEMGYLGKTATRTFDPLKGEACCYTLAMDGEIVEAAVCSYEDPLPGAEARHDDVRRCARRRQKRSCAVGDDLGNASL